MAVDIQGIEALYDSLEAKIKATLDEQWNEGRLTGSDYAQVLSSTLTETMQLAVKTVQNQPIVDAQIAESNAKISLLGSQKAKTDSDKAIAEEQSGRDALIKESQKALIDQQQFTEIAKKELTQRQTTAYEDKLRIEEAKQLANVTGMFGAGGTALPAGLDTKMFDAIAAITP